MKIGSYRHDGKAGYGVFTDRGIVDLTRRIGDRFPSLLALLEGEALDEARRAAEGQAPDFGADAIDYLPLIPDRVNIFCTGLNFRDHIEETGQEPPKFPRLFMKLDESLVGHGQPIIRPKVSDEYDFEAELMVVMGRTAHKVSEAAAMDHVAGYSVFNDGSIRDYQRRTTDQGKNFYHSSSVGPYMVTLDEVPPESEMKLTARLNGRVEQSSSIDQLIFTVPVLISYFSSITRLRPGDMIAAGTCGRIDYGAKRFMKGGDVIEVEIAGVGTLTNPVVDEG